MRLLQLDDCPSFSLAEFAEDQVPRYAILSHTWGHDGDEITYKDIINGTGSGKAGYDKLRFCAVQAKNDGLGYCWIDTCCIDKTNAAELTESINSMFRWYQNAVKCYVFLADISTPMSEDDRASQLRNSRWFTRGWTLQELIAPRCVEFFSQKRELLGDRKSLEKQIHQVTGISIHALRGELLSHFTINERMSWAANRTTKRPEDKVYSLLGIFDIHMEAIYGEGEHHASRRLLRELERYSENHQLSEFFRDQLKLSSSKQPKTPLVNPTWIVPFERNPRFTGREPELTRLEEMLFGKHRTAKLAITGLGGVGKTQLFIELLYRVADKQKHCSVIWISAVNMESLHQSYLDVARQLGIPGCEDDKANVKRLVQTHLSKESTGQWLLVFDNADDLDMWIAKTAGQQPGQGSLINYLPKSKQGAVVFTTRDRKIAVKLAQRNVVDVPAMGEDAAVQLLGKCLVNPDLVNRRQDTSALLLQLTFLPLAIVQAAAYINENAISLADYISLLAEQEEEVIDLLSEEFEDDGRYRDIKNPVATTWLISFDQIQRRDRLAADYLSFMACIEPKDIPQSLLPPGASRKKEVDAIGTLTAYSFVHKRPADECLDLHRLVHLATRNWLRKEELLAQSTERAILRLGEVFPDHEHQNRTVWRKYLVHARYVLESDVPGDDDKFRTSLLWKLGMCLYQEGRWNEAQRAFVQVMETRKRVLGPEHPDTLISMGNLASTYRNQGRWKEAEELNVQVMETFKRVLGEEHPDTLTSMANQASTYRNQGRWKEAEELNVQVMETFKRVLGPEHPDTLTSMANLALTFWNQGRWKEAEELNVQVMETRKRVLGKEHPSTLTSMGNLASTYMNQGRAVEGGRRAQCASDGDEFEGAWAGASGHADQHGQPGVDLLESRAVEGGRGAGGASDGDIQEGAWGGASRHADQHGQPGVDVHESRAAEGGRRAGGASDGDEKEGAWGGASRHADQHGQPGVDLLESRAVGRGRRA
ncbi:HET-domain-containing protein [Zopfia rhizophila CBS 207.26]|uniref:HET-domain-containing protein n=1 Tax=Zopfia rhizophila CBS 207.26 TaxID=1314779 RepID=A0A6A6EK78_9PEZI|nr:HET-domain-containing protein [Zopfia rhizophila CBS 207.26]